ncbi:hypothetical protein GOM49_04540 [Clostridium bovifaecis]|uniref:Aquaporin n=1 Tax=Clostridium bovifaecis TaxID=2184719 RepID=A0A6I6EUD1_9CLOT|nr:hypothetical protein GOM49_04540 [Clostridium bovifaecis]
MSTFLAEFLCIMMLILLGDGVVAGVCLKKSKAENSGWIVITVAWAIAVLIPALIFGEASGAHFNPAITIALAAIILVIGFSLGGPTGYAINPARDLGPRIAHAILPIAGKGDLDWGYAWIPVVGPIIGALIGAFLFTGIF